MKIAIDCSHHRVPGGVRSYIENLLWGLGESTPESEFVLVYRGRQRPVELPPLPPGAKSRLVHVRAPARWIHRLENSLGWPSIERSTGAVDVVHGIHFALPVSRGGAARTVLTVQDITYLRHPQYFRDSRLNDYGYRYLLGHSLRRADAVIVPSHATLRDLIDHLDVDPERLWVVPHGLDPRIGSASAEEVMRARSRFELPRPYAVYPVGTLDIRKNLPRTLEAFAQAFPEPTQRPDLVLTGLGELPSELADQIVSLGIDGSVRLLCVGYPEELSTLLTGAEWGLYPSLAEGFGFPPLEAMACGLPMLVSNRTSCPEVVGEAAVLVDPEDVAGIASGMLRLNEDESLRELLRSKGRERATSAAFQWSRVARQTLAVYANDRAAFAREPDPTAGLAVATSLVAPTVAHTQ